MFESVKNFFGKVGNFFVDSYHTVVNKVSEIYHGVVDTGKSVVTTIHQDIKDYASGVKEVANKVVDRSGEVLVHGEDTIGAVGKSFAWPLTIGAIAVGGMYLMKK